VSYARLLAWVLLLILGTSLLVDVSAYGLHPPAQAQPSRIPRFPTPQEAPKTGPEDEARQKLEHDQAKKANEDRHAAVKRDTDKLLQLSTELKTYVDRTNENTLSLDVIRKAEEIEKLAHSVREKMKGY
jgi:hypothetical protein